MVQLGESKLILDLPEEYIKTEEYIKSESYPKSRKDLPKLFASKGINKDSKKIKIFGSGISQTNHEIKDILKVIRSLENRGILLKRTAEKIVS